MASKPITRGITAKLAERLQVEFNRHQDRSTSPFQPRLTVFQPRLTNAEARAVIAALRYVLLAPGYTR